MLLIQTKTFNYLLSCPRVGLGVKMYNRSNLGSFYARKLTLVLLNPDNPCPAEPGYALPLQTVDPDQLASEEANWFGSTLFVNKYVNLYQQPGSSNLIGWKLEVDVAS